MIRALTIAAAAAALALTTGCGQPTFTEAQTLGGVSIDAHTLNRGEELYVLNCYACHGMEGDGNGPAAPGLRPPPRNFKQGFFKFATTLDDEDEGNTLPTDEDLLRIIKGGLHGTPMWPWDLKDAEVTLVIHYLKTFSERWKTHTPGKTVDLGEDPWKGKEGEARAEGKRVYHAVARCWSCHPSYATKDEFFEYTKNPPENDARDDFYRAELKSSGAMLALKDGKEREVKVLPPDFLMQPVRSIYEVSDVYRVVATGVGGAAMPAFPLAQKDGWALAHYVWQLVQKEGTKAGLAQKKMLMSQPEWKPPAPPPPPPAPDPAPTAPALNPDGSPIEVAPAAPPTAPAPLPAPAAAPPK